MGLSNYAENKIQEHLLRAIAYTAPATVYAALYTSDPTDADTGTEVSGGAYARQAITFGAVANGVCTNSSIVTFPVATLPWGTVTHFGIRDALTGGNLIYSGSVGTAQDVIANNQVIFNVGQISCTLD